MTLGKYDNVLVPFAALMAQELHANSHKGDREAWVNLTRDGGMFEVYDHASKLAAALRVDNHALIREHAADVANAAMMLLDAWGLLLPNNAACKFASGGACCAGWCGDPICLKNKT